MKRMEYGKERTTIVLAKGKTKGFYWCIVSLGTHPVAYVGLPQEHKDFGLDYDDIAVDCHGGLTFADTDLAYNPIELKAYWIGWDYAHCGDYTGYVDSDEKRWTTEEIYDEVMSVINQLEKKE